MGIDNENEIEEPAKIPDDELRKPIDQESTSEITDSFVERHDLYNFEAKVEYNIHRNIPINEFDLTIYYFVPQALQINEQTYPREKFFADLNDHIRFKTPRMTIAGIINPQNDLSPLNRILQHLEKIKNGNTDQQLFNKIIFELRLLGSIMKSTMRDQIKYFISEGKNKETDVENLKAEFANCLRDISQLQKKMRLMDQDFLASQIPQKVRETYHYSDDFISLQITDNLVEAIQFFQDLTQYQTLCDDIIPIGEYEQKHRRGNSNLYRKHDSKNESYTYYEGILKKYCQGVLYLNRKEKAEPTRRGKVIQSIVIGAIALGIILAILIGFSKNLVVALYPIVGIIIGYIIALQIRGDLKNNPLSWSRNIFIDKRYEILSPESEVKSPIGVVKEVIKFLTRADLPPEIVNIRQASNLTMIEQEGKPETIMRFTKNIKIYMKGIEQSHKRFGDINDILRFNIRNFTQYADDPEQKEAVWDSEKAIVDYVVCEKVYHLNLIFQLRARDAKNNEFITYKKVRIILDQRGIKRVQEVPFKL